MPYEYVAWMNTPGSHPEIHLVQVAPWRGVGENLVVVAGHHRADERRQCEAPLLRHVVAYAEPEVLKRGVERAIIQRIDTGEERLRVRRIAHVLGDHERKGHADGH